MFVCFSSVMCYASLFHSMLCAVLLVASSLVVACVFSLVFTRPFTGPWIGSFSACRFFLPSPILSPHPHIIYCVLLFLSRRCGFFVKLRFALLRCYASRVLVPPPTALRMFGCCHAFFTVVSLLGISIVSPSVFFD